MLCGCVHIFILKVADVGGNSNFTKLSFYINSQSESAHYKPVRSNKGRLMVLSSLLASFFCGGTAGAVGFKYIGYSSTIPLAAFLVLLALVPLVDDVRTRLRVHMRHQFHDRRAALPSHGFKQADPR